MTNYTKEQLEIIFEQTDQLKKKFAEYLECEDEAFRLMHSIGRNTIPCETTVDAQVESYWRTLFCDVTSLETLINRETECLKVVCDHLENEVAREEMRAHVNPDVMPFADEDVIRKGA